MGMCKICGCFVPDGAGTCIACWEPQTQMIRDRNVIMTNQQIKRNLLVLLEDYNKKIDAEVWKTEARKTVILAFKAIDAYEKALDDEE